MWKFIDIIIHSGWSLAWIFMKERVKVLEEVVLYYYNCMNFRVHTGFKSTWIYRNIQDCLEKSFKIKFALKSTWKTLKSLEKSLNFTIYRRIQMAILIIAVFGCTSTGRVGLCFLWFYVKELSKAQAAVVLVLKRLRRRGNGLKSHLTD